MTIIAQISVTTNKQTVFLLADKKPPSWQQKCSLLNHISAYHICGMSYWTSSLLYAKQLNKSPRFADMCQI